MQLGEVVVTGVNHRRFGYHRSKRAIDLLFGTCLLLATAPVHAFVFILVLIFLGRPVYFVQERPGLDGKVFKLIKFRSMTSIDKTESDHSDEARLTRTGRVLRSTSLDELPTLFNVLKGDMSLVGPRPLLIEYMNAYSPEQARRHEVRPGVTGLAQVAGRNLLHWNEKFALDVYYVDNLSFRLDLSILLRTIGLVICRRGISSPGQATTTPFVEINKTRTEGEG